MEERREGGGEGGGEQEEAKEGEKNDFFFSVRIETMYERVRTASDWLFNKLSKCFGYVVFCIVHGLNVNAEQVDNQVNFIHIERRNLCSGALRRDVRRKRATQINCG